MWFKHAGDGVVSGLDVLSQLAGRNPFPRVLFQVGPDTLFYPGSGSRLSFSLSAPPRSLVLRLSLSSEKRLLDLFGRLLPLFPPIPAIRIDREGERGTQRPEIALGMRHDARCPRFRLRVLLHQHRRPARGHVIHTSPVRWPGPRASNRGCFSCGRGRSPAPPHRSRRRTGPGASSSGGPRRLHCPSILAGVKAVRVSTITIRRPCSLDSLPQDPQQLSLRSFPHRQRLQGIRLRMAPVEDHDLSQVRPAGLQPGNDRSGRVVLKGKDCRRDLSGPSPVKRGQALRQLRCQSDAQEALSATGRPRPSGSLPLRAGRVPRSSRSDPDRSPPPSPGPSPATCRSRRHSF